MSEKWARPAVRLRQLDLDASDDGSFGAFAGCFWEENRANEAAPEIPCKHNYEWSHKNRATASCVTSSAGSPIHRSRRRKEAGFFVSAFRVPHSVPSKCLPPAIGGYGLRGTHGCPAQACIQRAAVVNCTGALHRLQRPVMSFIRTRARYVAPGRAADAGGEGGDLVGGPCALKLTIALRAAIKNDDVEIGR